MSDKNTKFISDLGESLIDVTEPLVKLMEKHKSKLILAAVTAALVKYRGAEAVQAMNQVAGGENALVNSVLGKITGNNNASPQVQQRRRTRTLKKGSLYRRRR
tara:strand:- start:708 stop:1016 length:309 start_codon:yes stop_codon:yes gene_type:complete